MSWWYILEGKEVRQVRDIYEYIEKMQDVDFLLNRTEEHGVTVSTVFLGLNHSRDDNEPILFETMIFGGRHDKYRERYCTYDEAMKGHEVACVLMRIGRSLDKDDEEAHLNNVLQEIGIEILRN
jgi:hypothetical protein